MASTLIQCPDCDSTISARARTCPKCGAPVTIAAEAKGAGTEITTTQGTSKKIKVLQLIALILIVVGVTGIIVSGQNPENSGAGGWSLLTVLGFGLYIYARVKRWWHHS